MIVSILALAVGAGASQPLPVPADFDPEVNLRGRTTEFGSFHESRGGASWAAALVANGHPDDLALAERVLDATLNCQERRPDAPRRGNFRWMLEDKEVTDPNAVEFVLKALIPMMIRHADRLSPEMHTRVLDSIRLGLADIREMGVTITYTNIAVFDILNTCTGGELLGDAAVAERGYAKMREWEAFTCANGTAFEFNSPTYTRIMVNGLVQLADLTQHEETRVRARTMAARLALSVALHIHRGTGRWAGPHSRAYQPSVECREAAEVAKVEDWLANGAVPSWIGSALANPPLPFQVSETASAELGMNLTTYHAPSFALGVGTRGCPAFGHQSNLFMMHYVRPGAERPGVVYARYLTNDKWLGDWYHNTDRTASRNLLDEGAFYGAQSGARAVGVYTSGGIRQCTSAKCAVIWTERARVDEIWVGTERVDSVPAAVADGEVVVVASGDAMLAVFPVKPTDLGGGAPIRLVEKAGDLVLEMHNYLGPETTIRPAADRYRCGFYAEAAERAAYADGGAFAAEVARGSLRDGTPKRGKQHWCVEYARDGQRLGLEVDLAKWTLERRWDEQGELGWPMLESPVARQNGTGRVSVGDAVLKCGDHPAWLFADAVSNTWVAGYHGPPEPLALRVPGGAVRIDAMGTGTITWADGEVRVDAIGLRGTPSVKGGRLAE